MKWTVLTPCCIILAASPLLTVGSADAQQRRVVVRRPAVVHHRLARTRVVLRPGHPLRRTLPTSVVVRPARRVIAVGYPLVFLAPLEWQLQKAVLPPSERLVWQESEAFSKDEGWVDLNFGVDSNGNALLLRIDGRSKLNFAEVVFRNGQVQVVDFNEKTREIGLYQLLDFADGRHVSTVRILVKSESKESELAVYLSR